jgi:hypothetical protein
MAKALVAGGQSSVAGAAAAAASARMAPALCGADRALRRMAARWPSKVRPIGGGARSWASERHAFRPVAEADGRPCEGGK